MQLPGPEQLTASSPLAKAPTGLGLGSIVQVPDRGPTVAPALGAMAKGTTNTEAMATITTTSLRPCRVMVHLPHPAVAPEYAQSTPVGPRDNWKKRGGRCGEERAGARPAQTSRPHPIRTRHEGREGRDSRRTHR